MSTPTSAAAAREAGGIPDDQFVGDADGAIKALRALPTSNGKVGVIGYCSGGRHAFLTPVSLPVDAAVGCYGAFVTGTPPEGFPLKVTPLVDRTPRAALPAARPVRQRGQVPQPRAGRRAGESARGGPAGRDEFHRYDGAGHAITAVDRKAYRPEASRRRHGGTSSRWPARNLAEDVTMMLLTHRGQRRSGQRQRAAGLVIGHVGTVSTSPIPFHAPDDHTLDIAAADRRPVVPVRGSPLSRLSS